MYLRCLALLIAVLVFGAPGANAQSSTDAAIKSPCEATHGDSLSALESRRLSLEREIARKTKALEEHAKKKAVPASDAKAKELDQSLHQSQEDLMEVLFRIDCVRQAAARPPERKRASRAMAGPAALVEITTYYATNRNLSGSAEPTKVYGTASADTLQYGRAVVSIPFTHKPGSIELPTIWKLEREADPNKHFVLKSVTPGSLDEVRREMAGKLETQSAKTLLIFVHGYYMSFTEAALRTAQLAHDLKFPGLAFFFSWPSASQIRGYLQDEEASRLSEGIFERIIDDVSQLPVTDIYIVAHSMGNRIVGHALQSRAEKGKETRKVRELLLAAPDINADLFRTVIAPKLAAMQGTHTTLYASSADIALRASKIVHGFRRVGETTGGVFTYPPFETIDASSASLLTRNYGHSYVMDSASVLKDIQSIIQEKATAKQRGLSPVGASPNTYWRLP
jgi:esterase/lipase superfamily enzyme